jgi:hypothetical protein
MTLRWSASPIARSSAALGRNVARSISVHRGSGDAQTVALDGVGPGHAAPPVHDDAGDAAPHVFRDRDLDRVPTDRAADAPEDSGTLMAQERLRPAGQERRHPASPVAEAAPADRVDALPDRMQAAFGDAVDDRRVREAPVHQLRSRDDAVLSVHELPQLGGRVAEL